MAKAGEEALRASASSEALHYYRKALRLYVDQQGQAADPEKLAQYEKNIAIALSNKLQWVESVKYFEKVLDRWGAPLPKKGPVAMVRLIGDFLVMIKALYIGRHRPRKALYERENEILECSWMAIVALGFFDNFQAIKATMATMKRHIRTGISTLPNGWNSWVATSAVFSAGGLSFKLSNRMLEISQRLEKADGIGGRIQFACHSTCNQHCQGTWDQIKEMDRDLLDSSFGIGDVWHSSNYLWYYGVVKGEQGKFKEVLQIIETLFNSGQSYDNSYYTLNAIGLKVDFLVRKRAAYDFLMEADQFLLYAREKGTENHEFMLMAFKSESQILLDDWGGANESFSQAKAIYDGQKRVVPLFLRHIFCLMSNAWNRRSIRGIPQTCLISANRPILPAKQRSEIHANTPHTGPRSSD